MRVLITNHALAKRAGTELYVRDLCGELQRRGHVPTAFSCQLGSVADLMRQEGIEVLDDLRHLEAAPDVIHAQHWFESNMAAMAFPRTPMLHMCHGALPWLEHVPTLANIVIHAAVDFACRERVVKDRGIEEHEVRVFPNFVDMTRFQPRPPLPERPKTALVFSNYAGEDGQLPAIQETCRRLDIELTTIGETAGTATDNPEHVLADFDLVFAKGRAALEALAVGCSVVLCDRVGAGPLVRFDQIEDLRNWNFGLRRLTSPLTPTHLMAEVSRYDAGDANRCHQFVRDHCGLVELVDHLESTYREILSAPIPNEDEVVRSALAEWQQVRRALGDHMWQLDPPMPERARFQEGRWRRKVRSIRRRSLDLLREFIPMRK